MGRRRGQRRHPTHGTRDIHLSQRQCGRPDKSRTACKGGRTPCNRPLKFKNFKIVGCRDFVIAPFKLQEQTVVYLLYIYKRHTTEAASCFCRLHPKSLCKILC